MAGKVRQCLVEPGPHAVAAEGVLIGKLHEDPRFLGDERQISVGHRRPRAAEFNREKWELA